MINNAGGAHKNGAHHEVCSLAHASGGGLQKVEGILNEADCHAVPRAETEGGQQSGKL
ncbi:hypothetical protein SDC9_191302 [bioreactor metagenome]|uniref:Uncharacterized protein n=1 Tax=bioreactor metagenome TaxID=1076179 RepID=A0A645HZ31_9ZZZZ